MLLTTAPVIDTASPRRAPAPPTGRTAVSFTSASADGDALPRPRPGAAAWGRGALRVLLSVVLCIAVAAGFAVSSTQPTSAADPELARLLLGMAAVKALLTLAAAGAVAWRLGFPVTPRLAVAYLGGIALMAGATVLIAHLALIPAAALIFHAGDLTLLVAAWRDRGRDRAVDAG